MKNKGFTLMELVVVIIIIVLLIAIIFPAIFGVSQFKTEIAAFKAAEQVDIQNNEVLVRTRNTYKIPLIPSIQGSSNSYQIFAKSLPHNAEIKRFREKYYIIWSPEESIEQDVIIITSIDSMKDEITITMRAD